MGLQSKIKARLNEFYRWHLRLYLEVVHGVDLAGRLLNYSRGNNGFAEDCGVNGVIDVLLEGSQRSQASDLINARKLANQKLTN